MKGRIETLNAVLQGVNEYALKHAAEFVGKRAIITEGYSVGAEADIVSVCIEGGELSFELRVIGMKGSYVEFPWFNREARFYRGSAFTIADS